MDNLDVYRVSRNLCAKHAREYYRRRRWQRIRRIATQLVVIGLLSVLIGGLLGWMSALAVRAVWQPVPVCAGDIVTAYADEPLRCDVVPPQRLDVILPPVEQSIEECHDMGGRPRPTSSALICEAVDY